MFDFLVVNFGGFDELDEMDEFVDEMDEFVDFDEVLSHFLSYLRFVDIFDQ
jgi:hypothetical protein